jgi:predicted transcriptional regulator
MEVDIVLSRMQFSVALRDRRMLMHKKLRELSEDVAVSVSQLSDMESGRRRPPADSVVEAIERALFVNDSSLLIAAAHDRKYITQDMYEGVGRSNTRSLEEFKETLEQFRREMCIQSRSSRLCKILLKV